MVTGEGGAAAGGPTEPKRYLHAAHSEVENYSAGQLPASMLKSVGFSLDLRRLKETFPFMAPVALSAAIAIVRLLYM